MNRLDGVPELEAFEHAVFLVESRVAEAEADEEAVELRFGERERALVVDGILGGDEEEGPLEIVLGAIGGDLAFGHGFEEGGLGAGVARLISSASTVWAKSGPGRNSNSVVFELKTEAPVMSVGRRSGVHWRRLKVAPTLWARARASMVLATPGTSSRRTWPSAK